jgi:hypothetical protein
MAPPPAGSTRALAKDPDAARGAAHPRLQNPDGEGYRDGGVHRIAAGAQHFGPRLSRQAVLGRDHAALGFDDDLAGLHGAGQGR